MRKRTYELYLNKSVDGVGIHYVCTSLPHQDSLANWLENLVAEELISKDCAEAVSFVV